MPFAPGGPADVLARLVGQKMGEDLGQQVIIDNRPGANTIIGAQVVAKAKPDGYTLLLAIDGTLVMNPFLYSKLSYDPFKDFEPIALIADIPSVLEANNNVPVKTVQDVIDLAKKKPSKLNVGVSTPTSQVTASLFNMMADVNIVQVPYKGGTTQITGILAGDIQLGMESANVAHPAVAREQDQDRRPDRRQADRDRARDSDRRRDPAGLRPRHLAERGGAGRHAEGDRGAALRLARQGDGERRDQAEACRGRHRADHQQEPGGVRAFIKSQAATREKVIKAVGMKLD